MSRQRRIFGDPGQKSGQSQSGRLVHIGDIQAEVHAGLGSGAKCRIIDRDGDIQMLDGFIIQNYPGFQEQFGSHHLEQCRIGAGQGDQIGANSIVGDVDIGDFDMQGQGGVFGYSGHQSRQRNGRRKINRRIRPVQNKIAHRKSGAGKIANCQRTLR